MGGKIPKEKLHDFSWELHISELKFQLKSNVVPIGQIKKGIFYHRALLFKVFKMFLPHFPLGKNVLSLSLWSEPSANDRLMI